MKDTVKETVKKPAGILSMTGFGSAEGIIAGQKFRAEAKSVNHRFLDLKLRLPREFQSAESAVKALVQSRFSRGAVELKVERIAETTEAGTSRVDLTLDSELAKRYLEKIRELGSKLGVGGDISLRDLAAFPDVLTRSSGELSAEQTWKELEPLVVRALDSLLEMRKHEGETLGKILSDAAAELETTIASLREKRKAVSGKYPDRIREKIRAIFESYPLSEGNIQAVLESRIAQELALIADRTDIEEELVRFHGHIGHLRKILAEGGQVGRKLDFVIQELGREINTLGNKAQDYAMSEEVVGSKVRLEQLREQVMNLE